MTKRVLLLLADGFEPLEAAGFTDVLGWANIDGCEPIELVSAGLKPQLRATFGFSVIPDTTVDKVNLSSFDALAIPGGFEGAGFYKDAYDENFLQVIRDFNKSQKPIASVCVASLSLGRAGVITGRRATTYHQIGGKRKLELEASGAIFIDQAIVHDSGIITSSGPGTGVEVAFELLELLTTKENAQHIRQLMRMPPRSIEWQQTPQVPVST
ncbi:MAG: 4-methyl-5(b-hydroxyethyl)-thiazole monophosphate biosynthesis [Paraglaciecola sp.]|jgi:4-methyl-5(b-hydroxyethyl)-thiazole monophosphate biosynthesis